MSSQDFIKAGLHNYKSQNFKVNDVHRFKVLNDEQKQKSLEDNVQKYLRILGTKTMGPQSHDRYSNHEQT